jgi:hypothetical protein
MTIDGWHDIIDKHDKDNLCSPYDVFIIRQRCSILCLAYIYALEEMNSVRWVEDCCTQAIFDSKQIQDCLLQVYLDFSISMLTTGHWLWCLGFSYNFLKEVVLR